MRANGFVSVVMDARARDEIRENGFTRRRLPLDLDIARALGELAHAAWSMPRDQYYEGGVRFRTLNRLSARIVTGGVEITPCDDNEPYVQLAKYNTALGGQPRKYAPLNGEIAASAGVRKLVAHHLMYLPLSEIGTSYRVNVHVMRFAATPSQPCDTSPAGLHKDGEKYLATHLLARCGAGGGEVVITDNDKREMDRFTMREAGECYVFDDDRIWHMLTPVETLPGNQFAFRDTVTFDLLPDGWSPAG
ncbi:MAG: 2OG-Fe dioxygenase family protein [Steroidobacteraceae bacterium]